MAKNTIVDHRAGAAGLDAAPRPERVTFGSVSYDDPYRWLEEDGDPEVATWQRGQDEFTQAHLAGLPAQATFTDRVRAIGETEDIIVPTFAGGRWFARYVPDEEDLTVVEVRTSPAEPGRRSPR